MHQYFGENGLVDDFRNSVAETLWKQEIFLSPFKLLH